LPPFSFNAKAGQCELCHGVGFEKIEMQFLSDIFIKCSDCDGKRYRPHVLQARLRPKAGAPGWTIAEMLDATVSEAIEFLCQFSVAEKLAFVAADRLNLLKEVGLGYLKLGQPLNTLSGGESQRLKLVKRLADFSESVPRSGTASKRRGLRPVSVSYQSQSRGSFFIFDEPTTGLHFDDTRILIQVFQRLVDAGHTIVVIEHNMDVIGSADWIIDLGPDAGDRGGQLVAEGDPEHLAFETETHTGRALLKEWESRERLKSAPVSSRIKNGYLKVEPGKLS
jgi:excinuclease ABC subunit A